MKTGIIIMAAVALVFSCVTTSCSKSKSILIVVTGVDYITGKDGEKHQTGYWLEEFSTPYKVFRDKGVKVTIATPNGNRPVADPASIAVDKEGKPLFWNSKKDYDEAMRIKAEVLDTGTIANLSELQRSGWGGYDAVFFPGGHAPMEDLAADKAVGRLLRSFHAAKKPTALVCHAPIALLSTVDGGDFPYEGYRVTAFSNAEETASEVGKHLKITPETALKNAGARYSKGPDWQSYVVEDRELITGQNPASSRAIADAVLKRIR